MSNKKGISLIGRIIKYSKKNIRKLNVLRHKTSKCDKEKFKAIMTNEALKSNLRPLCSGVYCWDNFLTRDECNSFISISKDKVKRSLVAENSKREISSHRTSQGVTIDDEILENISANIRSSIFEITQLPIENQEEIKVIKYEIGQEYKIHHDCHNPRQDGKENGYLKQGGFRVFSCLIYLNDGFKGGKTNFPELRLLCEPKAGTLLIWNNMDGRNVKTEMVHCGEPVIEGDKWAVTLWVRESKYNSSGAEKLTV